MTGRHVMLLMAGSLFLASSSFAQDDRAVPRGGGGGGGGSSSTGAQHTPSFHSSDSGSSSGPGVSSPPSTGSGSHSGLTTAERRHPRAGTGSGGGGYYPAYPPGYWGGYYPGYYPGYWGYWWPYGSYGWWGGYGGWGYPWGGTVYHYVQRELGAIRVLVDPAEARVYVDGYYAGTVDDFDGLFQRLHISSGRHEITLKLEGYKTHRVKVYVSPDATLKLQYDMEKGSGETFEDLTAGMSEREVRRTREDDEARWAEREGREKRDDEAALGGRLRLAVRPEDASVYVDGEFRGMGRDAASLSLPAGRHRIEVVRPGYRTQDREVEIGPQASTELTIELDRP